MLCKFEEETYCLFCSYLFGLLVLICQFQFNYLLEYMCTVKVVIFARVIFRASAIFDIFACF